MSIPFEYVRSINTLQKDRQVIQLNGLKFNHAGNSVSKRNEVQSNGIPIVMIMLFIYLKMICMCYNVPQQLRSCVDIAHQYKVVQISQQPCLDS